MISVKFENDILDAISKVRRNHKIFETVLIVVANHNITVKEVTNNEEYTESYQNGFLKGMELAKSIFDKR